MDLQYTINIYLTIFMMLIMLMIVRFNDLLGKEKILQFSLIFWMIIVASFSEWVSVCMEGAPAWTRWFHILAKTVDHSLSPVIALLFVEIITTEHKAKNMAIPLILHAILELISGVTGFIYYVDQKNHYVHGRFYWIYIAVYLICSLYFIKSAWKFGSRYHNNNRVVLSMILLFFISGVSVSLLNSQVRIAYICTAIDTIIVYVYYTGILEKVDNMTGLLNRWSYESRVGNIEKPIGVLFFDVDNFKYINDNYGHQFGDQCLKIVGSTVKSVYGSKGYCYRIGGDEFCVLLEKDSNSVEILNKQFLKKMEKQRQQEKRLPYVSVGYAKFEPGKADIKSAIKEADSKMYEWKQLNKQKRESCHTNIS